MTRMNETNHRQIPETATNYSYFLKLSYLATIINLWLWCSLPPFKTTSKSETDFLLLLCPKTFFPSRMTFITLSHNEITGTEIQLLLSRGHEVCFYSACILMGDSLFVAWDTCTDLQTSSPHTYWSWHLLWFHTLLYAMKPLKRSLLLCWSCGKDSISFLLLSPRFCLRYLSTWPYLCIWFFSHFYLRFIFSKKNIKRVKIKMISFSKSPVKNTYDSCPNRIV